MADADPTTFTVREPDGLVSFDEVALHRAFETDKAGKTMVHVWVTGRAKAADEAFDTINADVAFSLFNEDRHLGVCAAPGIVFRDADQSHAIVADDGLRIDSHERVTQIEVQIETSKLTRASTRLRCEPT